jgi:hypothetical protein
MHQRLIIWGDIGTDRKALLSIELDEQKNRVYIHAFPKDTLQKETQDALMLWKNGGDFIFNDDIPFWEVDANGEYLLPKEIRVDKPEIIRNVQQEWSKLIMSNRLYQLCKEEVSLLRQKAETDAEEVNENWNRAQELSKKYQEMLKQRDITWEQNNLLKTELDQIFDLLKAKKRLISERDKEQSKKVIQEIEKLIEAQRDALIYPEEWNKIFDELKKIQEKIKEAPLPWGNKRNLFDQINSVYDSLKAYRKTQSESHLKERISKLTKILRGIEENIAKDKESLEMQKAKLSHYIRGNKASGDWGGLLKITEDRIKERAAKATEIKKTLAELKDKLEKEQQKAVSEKKSTLKEEAASALDAEQDA